MTLRISRDLSVSGARGTFQFEFACGCCRSVIESPAEAQRMARFAGLMAQIAEWNSRFVPFLRVTHRLTGASSSSSKEAARERAIEWARSRYVECPGCQKWVCENCWDEQLEQCNDCGGHKGSNQGSVSARVHQTDLSEGARPLLKCPNCATPTGNGRFCAECGFDMASTHKTCPECGTLCARSARYCPDCGHGY